MTDVLARERERIAWEWSKSQPFPLPPGPIRYIHQAVSYGETLYVMQSDMVCPGLSVWQFDGTRSRLVPRCGVYRMKPPQPLKPPRSGLSQRAASMTDWRF